MSWDEGDIAAILERITDRFDTPIPIGGRCESKIYYRVEDLTDDELDACAEYVALRIRNVIAPARPEFFLKLPGGYTFFAERLCSIYSEMLGLKEPLPVELYVESKLSNGYGEAYRGKNGILVTDVITTARSTLEVHSKATLRGIPILCWATLIDRTFGPGPVPVVSAFTGAPVQQIC